MFVAVRARINRGTLEDRAGAHFHYTKIREPTLTKHEHVGTRPAHAVVITGAPLGCAVSGRKWRVTGKGFADALAAARRGESSALSVLYREFQPPVLRYLRAREPQLADDLASETWVAVAQKITDFDGDRSAFAAWLFTIARYRLADYRRTSSRRRTQTVAQVLESTRDDLTEQFALDHLSTQEAVCVIVVSSARIKQKSSC